MRNLVAQMIFSSYFPVSSDPRLSGEVLSAGSLVFPEGCVEASSQPATPVLENELPRWFGAGGLAVRPPLSGRTSTSAARRGRGGHGPHSGDEDRHVSRE